VVGRRAGSLDNGLAMCVLHHKASDLGVIGIDVDYRIVVAQAFHGGGRAGQYNTGFAGAPLREPQAGIPTLAEEHRGWHEREVFRRPARPAAAQAAEDNPRYGSVPAACDPRWPRHSPPGRRLGPVAS
jgi:hypothetical protein